MLSWCSLHQMTSLLTLSEVLGIDVISQPHTILRHVKDDPILFHLLCVNLVILRND